MYMLFADNGSHMGGGLNCLETQLLGPKQLSYDAARPAVFIRLHSHHTKPFKYGLLIDVGCSTYVRMGASDRGYAVALLCYSLGGYQRYSSWVGDFVYLGTGGMYGAGATCSVKYVCCSLLDRQAGKEPWLRTYTENDHHILWCHAVCSSGYPLASGCVVVMIVEKPVLFT
jgi:hypothetical protein